MTQDLPDLLLAALAASDALAPRAMSARDLAERGIGAGTSDDGGADGAADEAAIERSLRALQAEGLVDGFFEPYIAPRFLITRKGRDRLG